MSKRNFQMHESRISRRSNTVSMYFFVLIVILIITSVYYFTIERILVEAIRDSNDKTIEQYIDKVSYKSNVYIALAKSVSSNTEIKDVLRNQDGLDISNTIVIHRLFKNAINKNLLINDIDELNEITVYALNEGFPSDGKFISNIHLGDNGWWINQVDDEKGIIVYQESKAFIPGQISFIGPIIDFELDNYGAMLGYVKVDVDAEAFFRTQEIAEGFLVCDDTGKTVIGEPFVAEAIDVNNKEVRLGKEQFYGNFEVKYEYNYDQIKTQIGQSRLYLILVIGVIVAIMLIVRQNISKNYRQRINRMIRKIKRIETGDFSELSVDEGNDEIGVLDDHFNEMAKKLDDLISKTYLQELENKEAKIKALQYQIDPHFLFNTLESINALAVIDNNENIGSIIESLGLIYRYIVDKESGDTVTLKQELNHVKNYVKIQQYRFGFDIIFDVPRQYESCQMPKLTIQPFVENAINYAKGMAGQKLQLQLNVSKDGDNLKIHIIDNGIGMSEERVMSLQKNMNEHHRMSSDSKKKSIGIKNVNQRIKLSYGEAYGVKITSEAGGGTTVIIVIPYIT